MITYIISILLMMAIVVLKIPRISTFFNTYSYLSSVYFGVIFLLVFFVLEKGKNPTRLAIRKRIFFQAVAGALIYVAIFFFLGAMLSVIKRSPYDTSLQGIINNVLIVVPAILAREKIREYIINNTWRRKIVYKIFVVLILITLSDFNIPNIQQLKSRNDVLIYIAQYSVPTLANGILLTYLSFFGGFRSSAGYALTYALFIRLFPFIPDLTWLAESAIGIIFPIMYSLFVREGAVATERGKKEKHEMITPGYVSSLVVSILIIWFSVGVFSIYPSVILTGSMEPMIKPGDMILIKRASSQEEIESYQVGDVINFKRDSIDITHRIIEVIVDELGNYRFRTKGDNNAAEDDDLVELEEVNGKQIYTIPKVGLPALILRSYQPVPEGVVDEPTK